MKQQPVLSATQVPATPVAVTPVLATPVPAIAQTITRVTAT